MAIKDVRKIRTTYRAVQWTGEEADDILALMDGINGYAHVYNGDDYAYLYLYDKKGRGDEYDLNKYDWVVVSSKGKVEILDEDEYAEKYEDN